MRLFNFLNPYSYLMRLRRRLKSDSIKVNIPIISIGNLTMGGTGKTPLTTEIARYLEAQDQKVAIILRGYGRSGRGQIVVLDQSAEEVGDEALAYKVELPNVIVIVDEDRANGARRALELGADVALLDDGFQHVGLHRDLNILLVDVEEGAGTVLPFGRAREDISAARFADIVVFTNVENGNRTLNVAEKLAKHMKPGALAAALHAVPQSLELLHTGVHSSPEVLAGMRVLAVSSIAKPTRFHRLIAECGAVVMLHVLPDHAEYSEHVVRRAIEQAERSKADLIVTTTKDIVKARGHYMKEKSNVPVVILHHTLEWIENGEPFFDRIDRVITHQNV
jgi:tetraacyldisaccharide 4'-kinase